MADSEGSNSLAEIRCQDGMRESSFPRKQTMWRQVLTSCLMCVLTFGGFSSACAEVQFVVYEPQPGPGMGKQIVLVSGDEEYRSEECLPQLGKILSQRHGFRCTVLFPIDPDTGEIDPNRNDNIPGLEALDAADLMIIATRFRDLPNDQMKHIVDYVESGRPIMGLRTATHAFNLSQDSAYPSYHWQHAETMGGFGRNVLGETWISHHGDHGRQSTRGIVVDSQAAHPILRGIKSGDIWGPTDVYGVRLPQPEGCQPLVMGQVVSGMKVDDPPLEGDKNNPMMPVAWIKSFTGTAGKKARVFTTTMGAAQDLQSAGVRRLLVNATYWSVGLEGEIDGASNVDLVGEFTPTAFGFGGYVKGVKPADYQLK